MITDAKEDMLDPLCDAFPTRSFQEFARFLQQSNSGICDFIIALNHDRPVGSCLVYWHSEFPLFVKENIPEIVDLIVSEQHRRQGVASNILDEIEIRLINKKIKKAGLAVSPDNKGAQTLYKKRGYYKIQNNQNSNLMLVKNLLD